MDTDRPPDLDLSLPLDPHAPSEARHAVGRVDRPSPDLRDAVVLLTSELVTRALRHRGDDEQATITLRVWMPAEIVRVEVWSDPRLLLDPGPEINGDSPAFDEMLLDQTSDRWCVERRADRICAWFEIDRKARSAGPASDPLQHTAA